MTKDFNILLGSQLDTSQKTVGDLNNQINILSSKLAKLNLKINIDSNMFNNLTQEFKSLSNQLQINMSTSKLSSELDKVSLQIKTMTDGTQRHTKNTQEFTTALGETHKVTQVINHENSKLSHTLVENTTNYKKQREEAEKLNKAQREYWELRRKESVASITNTPDGVKQLSQYYKELEKSTASVKVEQDRLNQSQAKYWESVRNEKLTDMTSKSKELKDLASYYKIIQAEADRTAKANKGLIGTFDQLKSANLQAKDVASLLSKQYGDLEVRGYSLNKATGEYSVLLKKNSKENLSLKGTIDQVTGAIRVQNETVKQAKNVQLGFSDQLKIALERVPIWLGATTVYFQSARFGRQLIQDISEINQSMIMLERVSNATTNELERFQATSPKTASSLGVLNNEVQNTTAEIVRLGYTLQEAEELMKLSSVMKTVGSLRDIGDATDYLISIMKAFKVEVNGATEIVDYLNHVANTSSINMDALGQGLLRMSSSMASANNSIEETVGLLVSGYDITRNAEKTATALNTISMRLRGVGEDSENLEGHIPKLESHFAKFGLTLKKDENTFKSTYEIFQSIASVADQMTDMEMAETLELVAGKRQANIAAAIISNMQEATKVAGQFQEAQGSALREHEKYMRGVEAAQAQLSNSMTSLNQTLLHSETIIKSLNLANAFVQNAEAVGKMNYAMVGLTTTFALFLTAQRKAIINQYELQTVSQIGGFKNLGSNIMLATKHLLGFTTATEATKISVVGLNLAMSGLLLGIPLLVQGIGYLARKQEEARQKNLEFAESFKRIDNEIRTIDNLVKEKEKLDLIEEKNEEQKRKLLEIEKQIAQILPKSTTKYTEQNEALATQLDIIKTLNKENKDKLLIDAIDVKTQFDDKIEFLNDELEKNIIRRDELLEAYLNPDISAYMSGTSGEKIVMTQKDINLELQSKNKNITDLQGKLDSHGNALKIINEITNGTSKSVKEVNSEFKDFNETADSFEKTGEQLQEMFSKTTSKLQDYHSILKELNSTEGLSGKTKLDIIEKHKQFIPYLHDEKLLREKLIEVIGDQKNIQRDTYNTMLMTSEEFFNAKIKGTNLLADKLGEFYTGDLENSKSLASAKLKVETELINEMTRLWSRYYNAQTDTFTTNIELLKHGASMGDKTADEELERVMNAVNRFRAERQKIQDSFDSITSGFQIDLGRINLSGLSGGGSTSTPYQAILDRYLQLNNAIADVNHQLDILKTKTSLTNDDQERIRLLEQQNKLYTQQKENLHALANAQRQERSELEKFLSNQGFIFSGSGDSKTIENLDKIKGKSKEVEDAFKRFFDLQKKDIPALQREWWNLENAIFQNAQTIKNDLAKAQEEALQKQRDLAKAQEEALQKQRDFAMYLVDREIENLQRLKSELREVAETRIDAIEKQIKALEEQSKIESEIEERQKRQQSLLEAQIRLQNILKQKNFQILTKREDGTFDYDYVADPKEVEKQTSEIKKIREDNDKWERELSHKARIDALRNQIEFIRQELAENERRYDRQIKNLQDFKNQHNTMMSEFYGQQSSEMGSFIDQIKNMEDKSYSDRIKMLERFVIEYNQLVNRMQMPTHTQITNGGSSTSSSGGGGGGATGIAYKSSNPTVNSILQQMEFNSKAWHQADSEGKQKLASENQALGNALQASGVDAKYDSASGKWNVLKYHDGGRVGELPSRDLPEIVNKLFNVEPNEQIVKALKGELMIPEQNIYKNFIPNIQNLISSATKFIPIKSGEGGQIFHIGKLEFPNVKDGEGVVDSLKNLSTFTLQYSKRQGVPV